jgi:hypothetical protein
MRKKADTARLRGLPNSGRGEVASPSVAMSPISRFFAVSFSFFGASGLI